MVTIKAMAKAQPKSSIIPAQRISAASASDQVDDRLTGS
jgi:hypothetical protein